MLVCKLGYQLRELYDVVWLPIKDVQTVCTKFLLPNWCAPCSLCVIVDYSVA